MWNQSRRVPRPVRQRGAVTLAAERMLLGLAMLAVAALGGKHLRGADGHGEPPTLKAPHVVILKSKRTLYLYDGDRLIRTYPVDLGRRPVGDKRMAGDGRTPLGIFRIVSRNPNSSYCRFLGLDYPHEPAVRRGLKWGLVSPDEAIGILDALAEERCPNWGTELGGGVGLHGQYRGFDWTAGCVALADEHIIELFNVLREGDTVEILP